MNTQQFSKDDKYIHTRALGCGSRVKVRYGDSNEFNGNGHIQEISLDRELCSVKLDENPHNWGIDDVITLTFQPHRVLPQQKIPMSKEKDLALRFKGDTSDEEEEEERMYYNYGEKDGIIQVAGGGMMNGNSYATVEEKVEGKYWYCEYGKNPTSYYIGNTMIEYDNGFDIRDDEEWITEDEVMPQIAKDLRIKLVEVEEENKRLVIENKRLEDANRDYYLTGKGLKRLNRVEDENMALEIKMGGLLSTVEEYKNQAIQNMIDTASLSQELDIFKAKVVANIL